VTKKKGPLTPRGFFNSAVLLQTAAALRTAARGSNGAEKN